MGIVPVIASRSLPGEGFHTRAWAGGFVAVSRDGHATVLDGKLASVDELDLAPDVALSHDGTTWAWHAGAELSIGDPRGDRMTYPVTDVDHLAWSGDQLWVVRRKDVFTVEVRDRNGLLRSVQFPDPLQGASGLLGPHPDGNRMVLWFADDGVSDPQTWLLTDDGTALTHQPLPTEYEAGPPGQCPHQRRAVREPCDPGGRSDRRARGESGVREERDLGAERPPARGAQPERETGPPGIPAQDGAGPPDAERPEGLADRPGAATRGPRSWQRVPLPRIWAARTS